MSYINVLVRMTSFVCIRYRSFLLITSREYVKRLLRMILFWIIEDDDVFN